MKAASAPSRSFLHVPCSPDLLKRIHIRALQNDEMVKDFVVRTMEAAVLSTKKDKTA